MQSQSTDIEAVHKDKLNELQQQVSVTVSTTIPASFESWAWLIAKVIDCNRLETKMRSSR